MNAPPNPPPGLWPEDYYFEGPLIVFTAAYHLKRGYCCGSGCRHCPYRQEKGAEDRGDQSDPPLPAAPAADWPAAGATAEGAAGSRTNTAKRGNAKLPAASSITFNWQI